MSPADLARELLDAGRAARDAGLQLSDNPHPRGSDERPAWAHGWLVRDAEIPSIAEQIEELGDYACGHVSDGFTTAWVGPPDRNHDEEVAMEQQTTERQLIEAAQEIGGIAEMAGWASAELAERIEAGGKAVVDLTVGELLDLQRSHRDEIIRRKQLIKEICGT